MSNKCKKTFLVAMLSHRRTGETGAQPNFRGILNNFWRKVKFSKGKVSVSHLKHWFPNHLVLAMLSTFLATFSPKSFRGPWQCHWKCCQPKVSNETRWFGPMNFTSNYLFWDFFCTTIFCRYKITLKCSSVCSIRSGSTPFPAFCPHPSLYKF